MHALANSLGRKERDLLREAEPERLAELSEEELVALHRRIRRARTKYVGIYRRAGSSKVTAKGGRGMAKERNTRNAGRAEVFEDALARVSDALGAAAAKAAEELKASRLAAANPAGDWPGAQPTAAKGSRKSQVKNRKPTGSGRKKRDASSRAMGKKRQARKDSR